jgi:hypothetical protein
MLSLRASLLLTVLVAAAAAPACGLPGDTARSTTLSAATPSSGRVARSVVEQLSAARCDQEESCRHVGVGATYASRSACMEGMRSAVTRDVDSYRCPRGIAEDVPGVCVQDVKSEECDHAFKRLNSYRSCRREALCER